MNNKEKIIDVTFILSMKNGFDRVSIKQIQDESGLAAGSIYYYFKDKNEILEYMVNKYLICPIQNTIKKILECNSSFLEKIEFILNYQNSPVIQEVESIDISKKFPIHYTEYWALHTSIYHQHPEVRHIFHELYDELYDFYRVLIEKAIEKKEIREDINIEKFIMFLQTIIAGYISLFIYQPHFSLEKLLEASMEFIAEYI